MFYNVHFEVCLVSRQTVEPHGIGSRLAASNTDKTDIITYIGYGLCAITPEDGLGPSLVALTDLSDVHLYTRADASSEID